MSNFDDFKPGDRVAHVGVGDGIVTAVENGYVTVAYDLATKSGPFKGQYDRRWFEINTNFLFHRTEHA